MANYFGTYIYIYIVKYIHILRKYRLNRTEYIVVLIYLPNYRGISKLKI